MQTPRRSTSTTLHSNNNRQKTSSNTTGEITYRLENMTSTMRSVVLQKKLHELETELAAVFRLPLTDPRRRVSFDDVEQRFIFLENLLAAETNATSCQESSHQLDDIGGRLTALKAEFSDWRETMNSSNPDNHDDTSSICSDCNQDQGRLQECQPVGSKDFMYCDDVREVGSPLISEADKSAEKVAAVAVAEEEKMWSKLGKCCGVFGCGMIVGALCMVKLFSFAGDYFIQYEAFLIPPT